LSFTAPVSINEETTSTKISVYPNPSNGTVYIKANENAQINIYNSIGELVYTSFSQDYFSQHNLSMLPSGLYYVHAVSGTKISVDKLIISK
jgi:hypothetical protein